ncbi:hypothetical protein OIU79_012867, partial [Salix purpurea]
MNKQLDKFPEKSCTEESYALYILPVVDFRILLFDHQVLEKKSQFDKWAEHHVETVYNVSFPNILELAWFVASALLTIPVILTFKLYSTVF